MCHSVLLLLKKKFILQNKKNWQIRGGNWIANILAVKIDGPASLI